jgi:type IV pilus assembly protein PilM
MASNPNPARPRLACEITAECVIAARANEQGGSVDMHTIRSLPAGSVLPSLKDPNVLNPAALANAISDALQTVGGGRSRDVTAVLPDAAVRTVLLEFEAFPQSPEDAAGVVKLRMRKSLPFDVEKARLSYHVCRGGAMVKVVAAVALTSVIEEYEAAIREAGYAPGVVLPSTLAAVSAIESDRPTLVVKVDFAAVTVAILDRDDLRLVRTLENSRGRNIDPQQLADDVFPSVVFFQDTFNSKIERVLVGGVDSLHEVAPALEQVTGTTVEPLVGARYLEGGISGMPGATAQLGGVVGALV